VRLDFCFALRNVCNAFTALRVLLPYMPSISRLAGNDLRNACPASVRANVSVIDSICLVVLRLVCKRVVCAAVMPV